MFSLGSCLLVEGECSSFLWWNWAKLNLRGLHPLPHWHQVICSNATVGNTPTSKQKTPNFAYSGNKTKFDAIRCSLWVRVHRLLNTSAFPFTNVSPPPPRSAGFLSECGDSRRLPQGEGTEDPQQFLGVQLSAGWHGHLHERHHRRFLQLPEVSDDVTAPFRNERRDVIVFVFDPSLVMNEQKLGGSVRRRRGNNKSRDL